MKLMLATLLMMGSVLAFADGSSVSVSPHELRASNGRATAVVSENRLAVIAHRPPSHGGSKVQANKNKNLGIVNKSTIDNSTVGMSVSAR